MELPFSEACERNKEPILKVLKEIITSQHKRLIEIGAGTGQHAVFLAPFFPHIEWTPTEQAGALGGLTRRVQDAGFSNIKTPVKLEVGPDDFPKLKFDLVFTANTLHIMHWKECKTLFKLLGNRLQAPGKVAIYGPFNYDGKFTSPSNEAFDTFLKTKDPLSGIRSFEDVKKAMQKQGFELHKDYEMPANNRMLIFTRQPFVSKPKKP